MRIINGVEVLDSIEELVAPDRTAVFVIDMQNGEISNRGKRATQTGNDISYMRAIVLPIQRLVETARDIGVQVIYAENVFRNRFGVPLMVGPHYYPHRNDSYVTDLVEGTWEQKTIGELAPQTGDIVIEKNRSNAMYNTPLNDILKVRGIRSLILTGVLTEGCVLRTAVGTEERGYYGVILRDCVSSFDLKMHKVGLTWLESRFPVFDVDQVLATWRKKA